MVDFIKMGIYYALFNRYLRLFFAIIKLFDLVNKSDIVSPFCHMTMKNILLIYMAFFK